jgi:uncharacterized protein involved in exopolysaccharide biosynthesis
MLRSKVIDYEKDIHDLKSNQSNLEQQVEDLQQLQACDNERIQQQEFEIKQLKQRIGQSSTTQSYEHEYQELHNKFDRIVDVKLKYEKIIKAMVDKPELKPYIADILNQM